MGRRGSGVDDPNQLRISWSGGEPAAPSAPVEIAAFSAAAGPTETREVAPLVQRLPWDFKATFPEPLEEAIDNGIVDETDCRPANLKSLHDNYTSQCLATLAALDRVMDAKRQGIDPKTGKRPCSHAAAERLRKYLAEEPSRLLHMFDTLIDTYAEAFGQGPADAFRKAIGAWHAGVPVVGPPESEPHTGEYRRIRRTLSRRMSSALPIPEPLRSSVAAGVFGLDEDAKPVRPSAREVRAITEQHAERMMEMTDAELSAAVTKYAEDFGPKAAAQLERYVRRQQHSR